MALIPLVLPALGGSDHVVLPTPIKWLRTDGACNAREPIACSWLDMRSRAARKPVFADERRDLEVVLAAPIAGQLRRNIDLLPDAGGWSSLLASKDHAWPAGSVLGWLETDEVCSDEPVELAWITLAGKRVLEIAEVRGVIMSGWHDRQRGWWAPRGCEEAISTLTSLGVCELLGVILGDGRGFFDWFERCPGPVQMIHFPDHMTVPAAPLLRSQLQRTPVDQAIILADFTAWWQRQSAVAAAHPESPISPAVAFSDLAMATHVLSSAVLGDPFVRPPVLHDGVVRECTGRHALVLSLHSEGAIIIKHRRLDYVLAFHRHRLGDFGPAISSWLRAEFEPVVRSIDDIRRDLTELIAAIKKERGITDVLMLNMMSTSNAPAADCYSSFDERTFDGLMRSRELNIMLYQLARTIDFSIVDVDDLGAQLGAGQFMTDMVHQYSAMETAVRDEILRVLRSRGVPGF